MSNQTINLRIERRQDVLNKVRFSRSTLYSRIQQGLFVPPVSLGRRSVGWLEHETDHAFISSFRAVPLEFHRGREFKISYAICISGIASRGGGDFPEFARHQIALESNSRRGVYEGQTIYRRV